MAINLPGYYDHYDTVDRPRYYEQHLFTAESPLQSRELNELQSASRDRLRRISDALFKDGNVLGGGEVIVSTSASPGQVTATCTAGTVYLDGGVRLVPERAFPIAATGSVTIGIYLVEAVITALDDADLRDPAIATRNNQEPGAARLQVTPQWGYEGASGAQGRFFAVYRVEDGAVLNNAAPPQVNAVEIAISRYDRQSTGGFYLTSGMKVALVAGATLNAQTYTISEGSARVNGQEVVRRQGRRFSWDPAPDAATVDNEQHDGPVTRGANITITTRNAPVQSLFQVSAERIVTQAVTHPYNQGTDVLAFNPVRAVLAVTNAATNPTVTYLLGADYTVVNGAINWSPAGDEPATNSTYYVTYRFTHTITTSIQNPTGTGCDVVGDVTLATSNYSPSGSYHAYLAAVAEGGEILVSYTWALPRYDLLCLDEFGEFVTIKGVPSVNRAAPPPTPTNLLRLATIEQRWGATTRVINSAIRMVPMNELNTLKAQVSDLFALIAEERLVLNMTMADPSSKRGVFADPFLDDDLREPSLTTQTAAIVQSTLTLGVAATPYNLTLAADATLDQVTTDAVVAVAQLLITDQMPINPYQSFAPMPGTALLSPAVDLWTGFDTNWLSPVTNRFDTIEYRELGHHSLADKVVGLGARADTWLERQIASGRIIVDESSFSEAEEERVGSARYVDAQTLREIPILFHLSGFLNGEVLTRITIDDVVVFDEAVQ